MITSAQCRAARGMLKWRQEDLASKAEVSVVTIRNFENEKTATQKGSLMLLHKAFEDAGMEFLGSQGVQLKELTTTATKTGAE